MSVNYQAEGSPYYYGSSSFVDGLEDGDNEYAYNPNGAMTMDLNKGITDISYDLLNNISEITFSNNRSIKYVYAADGTRLRTVHSKRVGNSYVKDSTDYVGNLVMKNGQPGMYQFAGGYLSFANSLLSGCHYYIQDYQGSNRMVVNKTGTVEQITHYYPYGGIIGGIDSSPNLQQYKFEGKELDRTYGLDWYDIHARQYDPVVPSWHAIDPMSEKYYGISPYAYCANNPVRYVDPDGKEIIDMLPAQTEGQEISKQKFFNRWHDNSNSIILMGHGGDNGKSFITTNSSIDVKIFANNLYGMAYFLEDNSQTWNISSIASDKVELVLFSCDTGSYNGLAEDLSKQDDFQDISIFAPSNAVNINPDGSVSIDNDGVWREYVNGQVVNEYSGNTVPGTREFNTSTTWEKTPQNISWQK